MGGATAANQCEGGYNEDVQLDRVEFSQMGMMLNQMKKEKIRNKLSIKEFITN